MKELISGIHHVSALADAPTDFYFGILGLRMKEALTLPQHYKPNSKEIESMVRPVNLKLEKFK